MQQRNLLIARQKQILQQQNEELGAMREELSKQMEELRTAQELLNLRNIELSKYAHHLKRKVNTRDEIIDQQKIQMAEYAFINAHLLRHPLSNIMGLVALLKAEALPPETHLYLDYLHQSAQKLDEIIHRINKAVEEGGGFTRRKL
ncbi:MAG: hypothetical protein HC913_20475 [Microscillaceae bacterium]|nr:hypothetical protein [Microscillaceae bacterium]